jgi:hypothetical protein
LRSFWLDGGDIDDPQIDADADSPEILRYEAARVSNALAAAGLAHRFEIYSDGSELLHYLHFDWPLTNDG